MVLELAKETFNLLNNNVNYCHFKSNSHLSDSFSWDTDFDILVDKRDFNKFKEIIYSLWYKEVISQPWARYPLVYDFVWLDKKTWKIIHLHIHLEIITWTKFVKEYYLNNLTPLFLDENNMILTNNLIKIPIPELELILLLIRLWVKTSIKQIIIWKFPENINKEIYCLLKKFNQEKFISLLKEAFGYMSNKDFDELKNLFLQIICLFKNNNQEFSRLVILKLKSLIKKVISPYKIKNFIFFRKQFNKYYEIFRAILFRIKIYTHYKKILVNWWLTVVMLWPDWSWKSTIIKKLKKDFLYKINTQDFYFWTWDWHKTILLILVQKLLLLWKLFFRNKTKAQIGNNIGKPYKETIQKSRWFLYDTMASIYYFVIARDKYIKFKNILTHYNNWTICLVDRFPQNQFCNINDWLSCYSKQNVKVNPIANYFFKKEKQIYDIILNSKLNIVIVKLNIDTQTAFNRKKNYDKNHKFSDIKDKVEIINSLNFNNWQTINIDAKQEINKIILEIKNIIWKNL